MVIVVYSDYLYGDYVLWLLCLYGVIIRARISISKRVVDIARKMV